MKRDNIKRKIRNVILLPLLIVSLCCVSAESKTKRSLDYPFFHKGMSYASWTEDSFENVKSDESLESMSRASVNSVAIIVTWYQENFDSTLLQRTERTPSDEGVRHAIRRAHKLGMSVMLKPHVDLENQQDSCRSDIGFQTEEEWRQWFNNYAKFVNHYARMAENENVEFFCVGTELTFASSKLEYWRDKIIPSVRKLFSGQITYAANWDDYSQVRFWDILDYAGIDAYFPLSKKNDPNLDELKEGWKQWLGEIETWQKTAKKPVVFTECGYCSADSAAKKPWVEAFSGMPNMRLQADCYIALFETFWDKPWFSGVYWWTWSTVPEAGGPANRRFTPQNKPALGHVKEWYSMSDYKRLLAKGLFIKTGSERLLYPSSPGYGSDKSLDMKSLNEAVR